MKMRSGLTVVTFTYIIVQLAFMVSCKHAPLFDDDVTPVDTTGNPVDTTTTDDTTTLGTPCDPGTVYFDLDVLPLLKSNCAFSGCHDSASAQKGVVLVSYESVMATADVTPFDLGNSKIYRRIVETDPDKRMPFGRPPLDQEQIQLIAKWILQGALDLSCDPDASACDTTNVTWSQTIKPVIDLHCKGCHSGAAPSGGISLATHAGVQSVALTGKLYGVISWENGFVMMPRGGNQLPACIIKKIKTWIDAGAPDN